MKRNFAIVVLVAALALLPFRAFAANLFNGTVPISGTTFNPCNGDAVTFAGTAHEVLNEAIDANGGAHLSGKMVVHIAGTGSPSGEAYVGNGKVSLNENFDSGVTFTSTRAISTELIAQGSEPNFLFRALAHITVNPDGTVTSSFDTFTSACRG